MFWATALVADSCRSLETGRHGRVQRAQGQKEGKNEMNPGFLTETGISEGCFLTFPTFPCLCRAESTRWRRSGASTWRPNWATSKRWSAIMTADAEDADRGLERCVCVCPDVWLIAIHELGCVAFWTSDW